MMLYADKTALAKAKVALEDCLSTCTNAIGLRVATVPRSSAQVEKAVLIALSVMSSENYFAPQGLSFVHRDKDGTMKSYP